MIRKNLIAMTAAVAAVVSMSASTVPAVAGASLYQASPAVAEATYKQDASHWVTKCKRVRVDTGYGWKWKKVCKKVWPKHYNSY